MGILTKYHILFIISLNTDVLMRLILPKIVEQTTSGKLPKSVLLMVLRLVSYPHFNFHWNAFSTLIFDLYAEYS